MGNTIINGIEIAESDFTDEMTFEDAMIACEKLGDGWRLPTIREAIEIFDKNPYLLGEFNNTSYCTSSLTMGGEVWLHLHSEQKDQQRHLHQYRFRNFLLEYQREEVELQFFLH